VRGKRMGQQGDGEPTSRTGQPCTPGRLRTPPADSAHPGRLGTSRAGAGAVLDIDLVTRSNSPQCEQRTSATTCSPQERWRSSAGGPASPAVQRSPQAVIAISTWVSSSPFGVNAYSWRGGRSEYCRRSSTPLLRRAVEVSTKGEWQTWFAFFLETVEEQARDAVRRASRLQALRDDYRAQVATARSSRLLGLLVDEVFRVPGLTIGRARQVLGVSHRAAMLNVEKLVAAGMTEVAGRGRPRLFIAAGILRVLDGSIAD
jgi:hypothetical protein